MISVKTVARAAVVAAMVLLAAGAVQAVVIDTVPVGNPGNAADIHGAGYGAVNYEYNIGKYEVMASQYTGFLNAVAKTDTYGLYNTGMDTAVNSYGCNIQRGGSTGNYTYTVAPDYANRPVNYVCFWDACRFANWLHNGQPTGAQGSDTTETGAYTLTADGITNNTIARNANWKWAVTSEDEWYKAAYHKNGGVTGDYFDYATSSDNVPGRDMTEATNPGNNGNYYGNPWPIDSATYYNTVAGEFQLSDSPYGTFDQDGNVWEWNEATISSSRGLRGGSFLDYDSYLRAAYRGYYGLGPGSEDGDVGFRVSEVPEPATLSLLAVGGLMALRRRR
ncbi:MAG: SUMF1/EgtB/PvdO family nonheme iron enzyme [Planctomycetota bacterium]|nr:SUMF1/EgtB/PvdO family nonheme iron enzyme [Planctomycetota bacterium]